MRLVLLLISGVLSEVYLHFPPGSNNRVRERHPTVQNPNRLFNSQNSDKGGYSWVGDAKESSFSGYSFFNGSVLSIKFSTDPLACEAQDTTVVIQYICDDPLGDTDRTSQNVRDPMPQGVLIQSDNNNLGYMQKSFQNQNNNGNLRIPLDKSSEFYTGTNIEGKEYGLSSLSANHAKQRIVYF